MGLLMLSGCGFVLHGEKQDITFDSKPPGAAVTLDNRVQFVTPHTISIPRASSHQATFTKEGYDPQHISIKHAFLIGPSIIGNILPLFPVGLAIDVMTGAAWGFEQDYVAVDMTTSKARP
jgi:PEGA domain